MKYVLLIMVMTTVLGACQKKSDQEGEDFQLRQATRQIDKGEYDQAIEALQKLKAQNHNPKTSMILASAYAGRAGVKVENYWGFTIGYEALLSEAQKQDVDHPGTAFFKAEVIKGLGRFMDAKLLADVNEGFTQLNRIMTRIEKIPYLPREKREDVQTAVRELSEVKTEGAALYRAILEIILLRSAIGDIRDRVNLLTDGHANPCQDDVQELFTWVEYSYRILRYLLADIERAYPSQKPNLEKAARVLDENQKFLDFSSWQASLSLLKACE